MEPLVIKRNKNRVIEKRRTGPTISSGKISRNIDLFNYLTHFSTLQLDKLSPVDLFNVMDDYTRILAIPFYRWSDSEIEEAKRKHNRQSESARGLKEIKDSLTLMQEMLLFTMANLKYMIDEKEDGSLMSTPIKTNFVYDREIDDFVAKVVLSEYGLEPGTNICNSNAIKEIFIFTISQICSVYPIRRFHFCDHCGILFFNPTRREKLFCSRTCAAASSQAFYRLKHGL